MTKPNQRNIDPVCHNTGISFCWGGFWRQGRGGAAKGTFGVRVRRRGRMPKCRDVMSWDENGLDQEDHWMLLKTDIPEWKQQQSPPVLYSQQVSHGVSFFRQPNDTYSSSVRWGRPYIETLGKTESKFWICWSYSMLNYQVSWWSCFSTMCTLEELANRRLSVGGIRLFC